MNRNRHIKNGISYFILISIILLLVWLIVPFENIKRHDPLVLITFAVNGLIWTALLLHEVKRHPYSFAVIHWCFFLLFFFFAAIVQYMNGCFPWIGYRDDAIVVDTNITLFFWTVGVVAGTCTRIARRGTSKSHLEIPVRCKNIGLPILILAAILLWRIKTVGFVNLLSRGTSSYSISDNGSISLLVENCIQALSYFSTAMVAVEYKNKRCGPIELVVSFVCLLVSYPPTGVSRYAAAAIYMGLMLTFFDSLKKNNLFIFILLGGFSFILPLLNAFRNVAFEQVNLSQVAYRIVDNFSTMWLAGDYDAYTMLTLVLDSVSQHGCAWMRQLLGVVLFWVPRNVWKNKPTGSGYYVAEQLGWSFKNISCPLPGEAYINLGIVGVIVFSFLIGRIMKYLDVLYWNNRGNENRRIDFLYPVTIIFFFFMCRGDLLSSTAYMTAYIVIGFILTAVEKYHSS